jgi:hypothetical protein
MQLTARRSSGLAHALIDPPQPSRATATLDVGARSVRTWGAAGATRNIFIYCILHKLRIALARRANSPRFRELFWRVACCVVVSAPQQTAATTTYDHDTPPHRLSHAHAAPGRGYVANAKPTIWPYSTLTPVSIPLPAKTNTRWLGPVPECWPATSNSSCPDRSPRVGCPGSDPAPCMHPAHRRGETPSPGSGETSLAAAGMPPSW